MKRQFGQHFLADRNILDVIGRLAELTPDDVVLEIGPGRGVLTRYLSERVALVHAVEIDRDLEPELRDLGGNVDLVFADALRAELPEDATKLVSNLPYNVATPLIVESLDGLANVRLWCVMVQREVADRLFAEPGTKAYGAVSVLVRLAAERTGFHPVPRTVFRPPPNVDSALVAFRRVGLPHAFERVKGLVNAAFAHRRKTLPNSLELSGFASREDAADALVGIGLAGNARAESLAPLDFVALAEALQLRARLPGSAVRLTGSASLRDSVVDDLDLVAIVDDVPAAAARLDLPPLHTEQWRDDWAAFRIDANPRVDIVLTRAGTPGHAHHVRAWDRLAHDPELLAEYRRAKLDPDRKRKFFDRIVAEL